MRIISTYAGHESSISFYDNGKITVVELDKLTNTKYFSFHYLSTVEKSELLDTLRPSNTTACSPAATSTASLNC